MQNNLLQRITIDPEICHVKPSIRGMRYTVQSILDLLDSGMTREEILQEYPDLEMEDFIACLQFSEKKSL
jgi:uncharacterized protein (DUF433 family)